MSDELKADVTPLSINEASDILSNFLRLVESGEMFLVDLPSDTLAGLRKHFGNARPAGGEAEAARTLLECAERHIFSDECLTERQALRAALAKHGGAS